ncbi:MAG: HprK-related kinase A [Rhodospirillales bacterium]|nr:MAG: HprK-related kinase A [Rhodospirillales bacterium]
MDRRAVAGALADGGLVIRCGPFTTRIMSDLGELAEPIRLLYADFPLVDDALIDFHVSVRRCSGVYRRLRRHIVFLLDDEPALTPKVRRLALPLLEWGANWCIYRHAHQYLIVHAAVVEKKGVACLLPGTSGAGKSTLCAALVSRGWRLLSDELALLRPDSAEVLPAARPISLKNRSIALLRSFAPEQTFGPECSETPKGVVAHMRPPADSVARMDEPALPSRIIFPQWRQDSAPELWPVSKGRAFYRVADGSINYPTLGSDAFHQVANLVERCECFDFRYSALDDAVATFDTFV